MSTYRTSLRSFLNTMQIHPLRKGLWIMLFPLSNSLYLPSHSPLHCVSYSTFLEVSKAQGSEILIKICLSPMGCDSSGGGCYREACGFGGFGRGFKSNGPFNVVWLCPLERLVWSYKIGPNWDGAMMGPTAETAVMRGGTLNWYQNPQQRPPLFLKYKPNPHTDGSHTSFTMLQINGS